MLRIRLFGGQKIGKTKCLGRIEMKGSKILTISQNYTPWSLLIFSRARAINQITISVSITTITLMNDEKSNNVEWSKDDSEFDFWKLLQLVTSRRLLEE